MSYAVIAHGPVVAGNMTIPYRVVLLGWYDHDLTHPPALTQYSTHTQQFPREGKRASLNNGHYFRADDEDVLQLVYQDFALRLKRDADNYGHNVKLDLNPAEYKGHDHG